MSRSNKRIQEIWFYLFIISFWKIVKSDILSAGNNWTPTNRFLITFDIWEFFESLSNNFKFHYILIELRVPCMKLY